ncbi:MAG: NAD(+)/NADH kinase [Carboxydocellales bacterium]
MQAIGLVVNEEKAGALKTGQEMVKWLEAKGVQVYLTQKRLSQEDFGKLIWSKDSEEPQLDFIIVLGGDGTLLQSARAVAKSGIPILGVNFGQLGFLTEIDTGEVYPALEKLLAGDYQLEERMMLEAVVRRNGQVAERSVALNDVVMAKGAFSRLITLDILINDEPVATIPADGVIVATPTGSTAYSLSAGGPIVPPSLEVMLITPICPHSLTSRPMVVSPTNRIKVIVSNHVGEVMLTLDGQHGIKLHQHDEIIISKAAIGAKFIKLKGRTFFQVLGEKLKAGDRCNV